MIGLGAHTERGFLDLYEVSYPGAGFQHGTFSEAGHGADVALSSN